MSDHQRGEDLESGMGGDVESRYKKMYEDDINPFTAFSKKVVILFAMRRIRPSISIGFVYSTFLTPLCVSFF